MCTFVIDYAVVLFLHGLLNTLGVRLVAVLNDVRVWWHILGVLIIVAALALIPAHHQSAAFVFTRLVNNTGFNFPGAGIYVFLIGLLLAQYTFTGYDASAHMTEETREADVSAPWGIVMSIVVSLIAGWILLLGVTWRLSERRRRPRRRQRKGSLRLLALRAGGRSRHAPPR